MAWTSPRKTIEDLTRPRPPKAPPLPKNFLTIRQKAMKAWDEAEYKLYKDLWCPCCSKAYHHVEDEGQSLEFIKLELRKLRFHWCKRCLDYKQSWPDKKDYMSRRCKDCLLIIFREKDATE